MINKIYDPDYAAACFFRSTVQPPLMKVMLQITEKCNLRCAHCFAESNSIGDEMTLQSIYDIIIPQFIKNNVVKVTLTGGEPLAHPHVKEITQVLLENKIGVSICTNGTLIDPSWASQLTQYNNVHFNVSLDGMTLQSHGKFRGITSESVISTIKHNISTLGNHGLLNGILTTPNKYAMIEEYVELCQFAKQAGANYVLMNPLSPFGRGTKTQPLAYSTEEMIDLRERTSSLISENFEIVYIRFPNVDYKPLGKCTLGSIPYVFCNGNIAICPYMVFASIESNLYQKNDFIIGNIFQGADIGKEVANYHIPYATGTENKNSECHNCGGGCYAIKIANNLPLSGCDIDMCPVAGA